MARIRDHRHPELSLQEYRTSGIASAWLERCGYEVIAGVGRTGVVGVLHNGEGATVLLRADMGALPVTETTGLDYASQATGKDRYGAASGIALACGHDMHMVWLMGTVQLLAENREAWSGTVITLFQPAEETGEGARAMIEDGLVKRFPRPNVVLGQHVVPAPARIVGWRAGTIMAASDSWQVTLFSRGSPWLHAAEERRSGDNGRRDCPAPHGDVSRQQPVADSAAGLAPGRDGAIYVLMSLVVRMWALCGLSSVPSVNDGTGPLPCKPHSPSRCAGA